MKSTSYRNRSARRFTSPFAYHGEGPFWDDRSNRLLCMDVLASTVVAIDGDGGYGRYLVPGRATTVIRHRAKSGFVIATERGLVAADDGLTTFEHVAQVVDDPAVRTNDGGCDSLGGFIIGTMAYDEQPGRGAVYRISPDRTVTEILAPVSISNGIQWSADGGQVYYIDTPTRAVDTFDVDSQTGTWSGRRPHLHIEGTQGFPDGMAIDEEGGLWIALWGAGAVNHYDRAGRLVETITVPGVTQVSSCAFGGDERSALFITTSRQGLSPEQEPDAGAVFFIQTGVRGAAVLEYGG
jgi:sugar lactone lactonase YvrE